MWRFWRKPKGIARVPNVSLRIDQLSAHLRRDLNLPEEAGFLSPDSIRFRKLPLNPSF